MTRPQRVQLKRTKGWRKPEGAVVVSRPSRFGNPFRAYIAKCCGWWDVIDDNGVTYLVGHDRVHADPTRYQEPTKLDAVRESVRLYNDELTYWVGGRMSWDPEFAAAVADLRGKDLACWCTPDSPCHADVLLKVANS